jgi:ATP-binding cassette subfamily B protein
MKSLIRLAGFLKPYWKAAVLGPLFMVIEVFTDLMQPRLMERIIDVGIAQLDMSLVLVTGAFMVGIALIGVFGGVGGARFGVQASQGFGADLRSALFRKVQSLSFGNLDELETGHLVTRLTNDVTQVQEVVFISLHVLVRMPMILLGSLIMAILTSPRLALMFLILGPVVIIVIGLVINKSHHFFLEVQRRLDKLNSVMLENLAGVRVVKAFVRAVYEINRFKKTNDDLMEKTVKALRLIALNMPFMMLALNVGIVCVIWFGGIQVNQGSMKVGQIIAFVNYLMQSLFSLMMVGMLLMRVSRAEASSKRLLEVLDSNPKIKVKPDALRVFSAKGRVVFEDVTFNYNENSHDPVLKGVSFTAEPGQTVAILGATGSGKSSLVHLIPRFYDIRKGRILLDNTDIRDLSEEALRKNIAIAMQEAVLFSGTIRENIRYGTAEATEEEIIAAAQAAQAHNFIMQFPDGYDTELGQRGVNLSGGQKQRLAIARALITLPSVLILDDSTSAVDVETESRIQDALNTLMSGRTSIIIAQRISTVLNADKIIVLDNGIIVSEGTHAELLQTCPIYQEIYESQLGNGVNLNE